jgi:hypothetical protein
MSVTGVGRSTCQLEEQKVAGTVDRPPVVPSHLLPAANRTAGAGPAHPSVAPARPHFLPSSRRRQHLPSAPRHFREGGVVGRFQRDGHGLPRLQKERHIGQGIAHGGPDDGNAQGVPCLLGGQRQRSVGWGVPFLAGALLPDFPVDAFRVARPWRGQIDNQEVDAVVERLSRLLHEGTQRVAAGQGLTEPPDREAASPHEDTGRGTTSFTRML